MKDVKVYLCGAIDKCTEKERTEWRDAVKRVFADKCILLDPADFTHTEPNLDEEFQKVYVQFDKQEIMECDILFAHLHDWDEEFQTPHPNKRIGSVMEIMWASVFERIIIVVSKSEIIREHAWIKMHAHYIADTLCAGMDALLSILESF